MERTDYKTDKTKDELTTTLNNIEQDNTSNQVTEQTKTKWTIQTDSTITQDTMESLLSPEEDSRGGRLAGRGLGRAVPKVGSHPLSRTGPSRS
jgi:hypothetical protein